MHLKRDISVMAWKANQWLNPIHYQSIHLFSQTMITSLLLPSCFGLILLAACLQALSGWRIRAWYVSLGFQTVALLLWLNSRFERMNWLIWLNLVFHGHDLQVVSRRRALFCRPRRRARVLVLGRVPRWFTGYGGAKYLKAPSIDRLRDLYPSFRFDDWTLSVITKW